MIVAVPDRLPLDMPPGNADALGEVVSDVAGAGFHLTVLSRRLTGPAATAPGWLGADAAAAAAQVGAVATLAGSAVDAVLTAMHRLGDHADRLHEARRRVTALRQEQDDDFTSAEARLASLGDHSLVMTTELSQAVAVVEDLRASEESRRRRHDACLEEVADDAAATAEVLAGCCAVVGGRGRAGDSERVVAYLGVRLPGWGDVELAARGRALAGQLTGPLTPERKDAEASDVMPMARSAAFARAFLAALGQQGLVDIFRSLADTDSAPDGALPGLLVAVLRSAEPTTTRQDPLAEVLYATYVPTRDESATPDLVALGMAVVLGASAIGTGGRLPPALVSEWGRQIIGREAALGASAIDRVNGARLDLPDVDPVPLIVELLGRPGAEGSAAELLAERESWTVLLARRWGDDGAALARLVQAAGGEAGAESGTAMRAGLEALGAGLDDGDPDQWTVDRATAAAVAGPLAEGLASHQAGTAGILWAGADGQMGDRNGAMLRGLAYLTIDRTAAGVVEKSLIGWVTEELQAPQAASPAAIGVPAAYLAVQEYGQRLAHALQAFEEEAAAKERQWKWDLLVGLPSMLVGGRLNPVVGVLEPFAARWLEADGSWTIAPDRGLTFDSDDAARAALARAMEGEAAPALIAVARESRQAFDLVTAALGELDPPEEPDTHWWSPVLEAVESVGLGRAEGVIDARRAPGK